MSVHKDTTFSTIIEWLPDYLIYDEQTAFAELQAKDPIHCHGTSFLKGCPFNDYVIYDEKKTRFAELQAKDLIHCHGTSFLKECPFNVKYWDKNSGTCMATVLNDKASNIHDRCQFKLLKYPATPGFRVLTESNILIHNIPMLNIKCHGEQNEIQGCCGCRITYGTQMDKRRS